MQYIPKLFLTFYLTFAFVNIYAQTDTEKKREFPNRLYIGVEGGASLAPSRFGFAEAIDPAFETSPDFGGYIGLINVFYQIKRRFILQSGLHFVNIATRIKLPYPNFTNPEGQSKTITGSADEYMYSFRLHWILVPEKPDVSCCRIRKRTQLTIFAGIALRPMRDKWVPGDGVIPTNKDSATEYFSGQYTRLADINLNFQIGTTLFITLSKHLKINASLMYNRGLAPLYRWDYEYKENNKIYNNSITGLGSFYAVSTGICYRIL